MAEEVLSSKAKILMAARRLFAQKGFENTSVDELAEEAQVAKGTIYVHFAGKKDILIAVIQDALEKVCQTVIKLLDKKDPFLDKFRTFISEVLQLYETNQDIFRVISSEKEKLLQPDQDGNTHWHEIMRNEYIKANTLLAELLAQGMQEGVLRKADTKEAASVLMAIIQNFVFQWFMGGFRVPISEKTEVVMEYFLYGLLTKKREGK